MKNVGGAYTAGMPRVAVIQAAFAIPVFECCNTRTAPQGSSIIYVPIFKSTKLGPLSFYLLWSGVTTLLHALSAPVKKALLIRGNSHENIS